LDEESGGDEQGEGHADFADDESIAPAGVFFAGTGCGGSVAKAFLNRQAGAVESWANAKEEGGQAGEEDEDRADAGVDVNLIAEGDCICEVMTENAQRGPSGGQACEATDEADEEAFGKKLLNEAGFGGSQSAADGELAAAAVGAREHKACQVGTGDEPHDGDGCIEGVEAGTYVVGENVAEGFYEDGF
jgi:hypothetical protein